jgi:hypothetical protein
MMVLFKGKERTEDEFHDLMCRAGFMVNKTVHTRSEVSIVEGILQKNHTKVIND